MKRNQRLTHRHELISEWQGWQEWWRRWWIKKKKYLGRKRGGDSSGLKFLLGSTKHKKTQFLHKVEHKYITQPSIPISRLLSKWNKNPGLCKTYTQMVTEALLTITEYYKQPKCPLTGERIIQQWNVLTVDYYSIVRTNNCEEFQMYHAELKKPDWKSDIIYHSITRMFLKEETLKDRKQISSCQGLRQGRNWLQGNLLESFW